MWRVCIYDRGNDRELWGIWQIKIRSTNEWNGWVRREGTSWARVCVQRRMYWDTHSCGESIYVVWESGSGRGHPLCSCCSDAAQSQLPLWSSSSCIWIWWFSDFVSPLVEVKMCLWIDVKILNSWQLDFYMWQSLLVQLHYHTSFIYVLSSISQYSVYLNLLIEFSYGC
jgi:hypothetical protein